MTVNSYDGLIAGRKPPVFFHKMTLANSMTGGVISNWFHPGIPGIGTAQSGLNGATYVGPGIPGSLNVPDPAPGKHNYVTRFAAIDGSVQGYTQLIDRLWSNTISATSTALQSITSPAWPARDSNGAANGEGVQLCIEAISTTGTTEPTIVVTYTNSAGVSGRVATSALTGLSVNRQQGSGWLLVLQDDDTGVRSVQSVQLSASMGSGSVGILAYRPVATILKYISAVPALVDFSSGDMPEIFPGSCLGFLHGIASCATSNWLVGSLHYVEGS
jgi:hypothetical protein